MDRTKKSRIAGNLMILIVSVFVCLLVAELVLRKISPVNADTTFHYRIPHPVFGWGLKPNLTYVHRVSGKKVTVTYNSDGFHDVEHTLKNEQGKFRIVVLGDSFMEAYSVQLHDAFHRQLEKLARDQGIDTEIINLGVGGYGTLQEYLAFHQIGKEYHPDIILLGFYFGNDLRNNSFALESLANRKKTANRLLKVSSRPFLDPSDPEGWTIIRSDYEGAQRRYLSAVRAEQEESFFERLAAKSALVQTAIAASERIADMINGTSRDKKEIHIDLKDKYLVMYGANYCKEPPEYTEAWTTTERILARLRNEVSSMGSKLVVFTVPAMREVDPAEIKKIRGKLPDPGIICLEEAPEYKRLSDVTKRLGIAYIDLLPYFRDATRTKGIDLYGKDLHWNKEGHELAARLMLTTLIERKLLPSAGTSDKHTGIAP